MDESLYTKDDIKQSEKFKTRRDAVEALLEDGVLYTVEEVWEIIDRFMKGCV